MGVRAVFLDRDGVLNELRIDPTTGQFESPLQVHDVTLKPDVQDSIHQLRAAGYLLIGITNQPAAAKGRIAIEEQDAIHARVLALLCQQDAALDAWRVCPHHPEGTVPELTSLCTCRKPAPGMILDAAEEYNVDLSASWMIGDSDTDVEAGRRAGTKTVLVGAGNGHKRLHPERADVQAFSLKDAVVSIFIES